MARTSRRAGFEEKVGLIISVEDEVKKVKELRELTKDWQIDLDSKEFEDKVASIVKKMSKDTVRVVGNAINQAFAQLGKDPIPLEDIIALPDEKMWAKMGDQIGKYMGEGLSAEISKALQGIDFTALQKKVEGIGDGITITPEVDTSKIRKQIKDVAEGVDPIKVKIDLVTDKTKIKERLNKIAEDLDWSASAAKGKQKDEVIEKYTKQILDEFNFDVLEDKIKQRVASFVKNAGSPSGFANKLLENATAMKIPVTVQEDVELHVNEGKPTEVLVTPTIADGAVAKAIKDNVAATPPVVEITPIIKAGAVEAAIKENLGNAIIDINIGNTNVDLRRKAQSMTIGEFLKDVDVQKLMQTNGLMSEDQQKNFWKQARYDKDIAFSPLSRSQAENIIASKVPKNLRDMWYFGTNLPDDVRKNDKFAGNDIKSKNVLEELILGDDELRNAALNNMWYNYNFGKTNKVGFQDFLNTPAHVYRGMKGAESSDELLSFSFDKNVAERLSKDIVETIIKPINTVGSVAPSNTSLEQEIWIRNQDVLEANANISDNDLPRDVSLTPTFEPGSIAQAAIDNVTQTPATVTITPKFEDGAIAKAVAESVGQNPDIINNAVKGVVEKVVAEEIAKQSDDTQPPQSALSPMSRGDAVGHIVENYDYSVWEQWFTTANDTARTKIADMIEKDEKLRNATLNQMWDEYKKLYDSSISFEEFLQTEIPLYRGENKNSKSVSEKALSFTLNKKILDSYDSIFETKIKPIDTLGMPRPLMAGGESEVFVPNDYLKNLAGYNEWAKSVRTSANNKGVELEKQLDEYTPADDYYSIDDLQRIQQGRQEILNQLEQEGLMTDEILAKNKLVSDEIQKRIDIQKAHNDAERIFDESDNLYDKAMESTDPAEVQKVLDERVNLLNQFSPLVHENIPGSTFANTNSDTIVQLLQENEMLARRIELLSQVKDGIIDIDDVDDIINESGSLESKLERLGDVASNWGSNIKDGNEDDVIDELEAFEETYDRIVLKLANGRKVEILPNAKGLRALHKYDDGLSSDSYGETEIDDVVFERKQKEVVENKKLAISYDELKKKLEAYAEVKREAVIKHYAGQDISDLAQKMRAMEEDITQYFDKNNSEPTQTPSGYTMRLQDAHFNPDSTLKSMCHTLGIEIPQAAEKTDIAIDNIKESLKEEKQIEQQSDIAIANNQKKIESYEELCAIIERLNEIRTKSKQTGDESNEEYNILERLENTKNALVSGQENYDQSKWNKLLGGNDPVDVKEMSQFLGIEIPQAIEKAEESVESLQEKLNQIQELDRLKYNDSALSIDVPRASDPEYEIEKITKIKELYSKITGETKGEAIDLLDEAIREAQEVARRIDTYRLNQKYEPDNEVLLDDLEDSIRTPIENSHEAQGDFWERFGDNIRYMDEEIEERIAKITQSSNTVKEEVIAHEENTQAIKKETQAQKELNTEKKKESLSLLDMYAKKPDIWKDKLQNILNENPGIIEDYTAKRDDLQAKMQPVQDATNRISKNSSVAKIPYDQLRDEIVKTGQALSTMYDAGITDTEEYITLQYKLLHLLDKDIKQYGTAKSAGAKNKNQLKNWQRDSILHETGYDVYSVFDALRGGKYGVLDDVSGKQRTMRDAASQLVGYKGFADFDAQELDEYKAVVNALTQIKAEIQSTKVESDALNESLKQQTSFHDTKSGQISMFPESEQEQVAGVKSVVTAIAQESATKVEQISIDEILEQSKRSIETVKQSADDTKESVTRLNTELAETNKLKEEQLAYVLKNNPAKDNSHTWVRSVDDIKTFNEALQDSDYQGWEKNGFTPDYTGEMAEMALTTGKITVYSSDPIELANWVTPSEIEAKSYAGDGPVYSKEVNLSDVAWVDPMQGQYAPVREEVESITSSVENLSNTLEQSSQDVAEAEQAETALIKANTEAVKDNVEVKKELINVNNQQSTGGNEEFYQSGGYGDETGNDGFKVTKHKVHKKDGVMTAESETAEGKTDNAIKTVEVTKLFTDKGTITLVNIIEDFKKFNKEAEKTEKNLEKAKKKLGEFLDKFNSKTGGKAEFVTGFNELNDFYNSDSLNADNIEETYNKMIELQKEYAKLELSFRKGQSSLNPFVNSINKAENIDNIFGNVQNKFDGLIVRSDELTDNFEKLRALADKIKAFSGRMASGDSISTTEFSEFAQDMGNFNLLRTQVEGQIKSEGRNTPNRNKYLKDLGKMYTRKGELGAIVQAGGTEEEKVELMLLRAKIKAKEQYLSLSKEESAILQQNARDAFSQQRAIEAAKQKDTDATARTKEVNELILKQEKLGKLEAQFEKTNKQEKKNVVDILQKEISVKEKSLNLTAEEVALMQQKKKAAYDLELGKQVGKQADKDKDKELKELMRESRAKYRVNKANSVYNSGLNIQDELGMLPTGIDQKKVDIINKFNAAMKELKDAKSQIKPGEVIDETIGKKLEGQRLEVQKTSIAVKELIANYEMLSNENSTDSGKVFAGGDMKTALIDAAQGMHKSKIQVKEFDENTRMLTYTVKTGAREFTTYKIGIRDVDNQMRRLTGSTKKTESFFEATKRKMGEISSYFTGMALISRVTGEIRKGIQYIREIDSALTELKKVTDETEETYDKFLDTASKTAAKVGSTIKEVVSSTADFARLGYSLKEAAVFAESAQILMNVSEFTDVSRATDTLISAVQAFGYTAETSMEVVDLLNMIGNNYAISTADLAQSLTKSSASLVAAGGNLAEAAALTATANKIIQDADSVGTALKTTSLRLRGTSVDILNEEGLDSDGAVTSKSKLQSKVQALSGVDILTATGEYKSTYEILSQIADVWEDINDMDQAALLELISGKRNSSVIAAILQNPKELKEAFEDANDAQGSALKENEKYLDSIQGKIDLFNNAVQTMWSNTLDSDAVKWFVDFGTALVNIIDDLGLIQTLFVGIGTYLMTKHDLTGAIGGFFDSKTLDKATQRLDLEDQLKEAKEELESMYDGISGDGDGVAPDPEAFDTASQKIDELNDKIKQNGMSIDDANAKMKQFGDVTNETGRKGIKSWDKLKAGAKKFGKQLKNTLKSMAIMYAITTALSLVGDILGGIKDWFVDQIETAEKAQEEFEKLNSELSTVQSELKNLNSELEDTQDRIDELLAQDSLSFTEQEELERLRAENKELERKIALNKTLEESLQQGVNSASVHATDMYLNTSFGSESSKTERQEEAAENYGKWGKYGGAAIGAIIGAWLGPAGALIGGLIGAGIGAFVGEPIGEAIGSAVEGAAYDAEQTVESAMDNMVLQRAKLKKNQDEALANGDTEAYKNATEALQMYDKQMAQHITQIQANYNAMDWETATTEEKKKMIAYADWLDKYSIAMGTTNAKSNAISRLFGEEADDKLKNIKEDIESAMNAAKVNKTDPDFDFQAVFNADGMEEFRKRIYDMGLTITDVKYYFLDLARAEKEAEDSYSTFDTVKQINSLSGGINALKDAFGEITEEGYVSTETLVELEETFGGLGDSWDNFVNTVATGTGSIKEATEAIEELVESYLAQQLASGPMSAEERIKTIMLLQQMGVKNAQEYVDAMARAAMAQDVGEKVNKDNERQTQLSQEINDLDTKINDPNTTASDKEKYEKERKEKQDELNKLTAKMSSEDYITNYIEEVEKTYGIVLTEKEKELLIEKAITAEKAKQEAIALQAQKTDYDTAVKEKEEQEEKNKAIDDEINKFDDASYIYENFDKYHITRKDWSSNYASGTYYYYNGKKYNNINDVQEAIIADLTSQKAEIPELPVKITETDITNAEKVADDAENAFEEACNSIGLNVDIVLADPSDLVDNIQGVFDTLKDAVNEYNENGGKLSVDTLQSILELEPQYLALLYDEEGQLKLNQSAILQVAEARIRDMGLQRAQTIIDQVQNALNEDKIDKVYELTTANHNLAESTWDVVEGNMATVASLMASKGMSEDAINSFTGLITGIKNSTEGAIADLPNTLSSAGNTATAETEDAIQKLIDYYSNRLSANAAKQEQIQNEIDLAEKMGMKADKSYYDEKLKLMAEQEALLQQKKADLLVELNKATEGSDEWWEIANELNDIESELDDVTSSIVDMQDAIGEIDTYQFDEFENRLDKLTSKLQTMRDLMAPNGEEDWFDEEGGFTAKGTAVLGSYLQELEFYKQGLAQVEADMAEFGNKSYNDLTQNQRDKLAERGIHSEQEYYDWVTKLDDAQLDYLSSISDTEVAIGDMYEASINAVEEYTQTLVESYNDYIDVCKEALSAERDLYDFKKNIQKQNKDIATTERRIAALSGSTNASDVAERRKLEAQLAEQKESLNDTYYEHSKEAQNNALDAEAQAYEESMNRFVENLRISLDTALGDMESFLSGVSASVMLNAQTVKDEYIATGATLDDAIVQPWDAAIAAIGTYETDGLSKMNAWTTDAGFFGKFADGAQDKLTGFWGDGIKACDHFEETIGYTLSDISTNIETNVAKWREDIKSAYDDIQDTDENSPELQGQGDPNDGAEEPTLHDAGTVTAEWYQVENAEGMKNNSLHIDGVKYYKAPDGYYYKFSERQARKDVRGNPGYAYKKGTKRYEYYAKGTLGTKQDQWAITDEIGDELVLVPGANGNLSFMRKGTSVVPADITANLVEWGKLNPDMMKIGGGANINMISNAVNKPEFNFEISEFLHVDRVDSDAMPMLEKMVDKKIDDFTKRLNYALKGKGGR